MDDELDPRIAEMQEAYAELEMAAEHMIEATNGMKDILVKTTWKRMDKMLGDIQKLEYDVKEWMIRNGIE